MNKKEIYLAGGCFWGTQQYFSLINGILETEVGYANGDTENPTYHEVCHEDTGHAETVKVVYDSEKISLEFILEMYYKVINPVSVHRQGGDVGFQYRTGIYYLEKADIEIIEGSIVKLQKSYEKPIAIESLELINYFPAEEYHQNYLIKNPDGYCHIGKKEFEHAKSCNNHK